jgi:RNA polymerase sigma-70 factor (ECF subfamily)
MERPETEGGDGGSFEFASGDRGPYGVLRNQERGNAIVVAIQELPDEYRELIHLRHFAELSYGEIAELKGMPLGTVKNKLFRGRQLLKEKLAEYLVD